MTTQSNIRMHHHDLKTALDGFSVTAAMAAFFEAVPWPEIAAFLSCIWIMTRLYEWIAEKIKNKKDSDNV